MSNNDDNSDSPTRKRARVEEIRRTQDLLNAELADLQRQLDESARRDFIGYVSRCKLIYQNFVANLLFVDELIFYPKTSFCRSNQSAF